MFKKIFKCCTSSEKKEPPVRNVLPNKCKIAKMPKFYQTGLYPQKVEPRKKQTKVSSLMRYERRSDPIKAPESENEKRFATGRLQKELQEIATDPIPNVSAHLKEDNLFEWEATIQGPPDSPYEGGTFLLDMIFSERYPFEPPKVTFRTKVYHCNINCEGWISMDILHDWNPILRVVCLLLSIQSLLTDCNPDDPLVPEIAAQYVNNREEHDKICVEWTKKYASDDYVL